MSTVAQRILTGSALTIAIALGEAGCGSYFPSFDGVLGVNSWIHDVPVHQVTTQVQCELQGFVRDHPGYLDPSHLASLVLKLQVDEVGGVTYLGVDLNKLGLTSVANLIAVQNKAPGLSAKGQLKSTVSSQVDLSVPQTFQNHTIRAKYVVDPDTGKPKLVPAITIVGLNMVDCSGSSKGLVAPLYLQRWLERFFEKAYGPENNPTSVACMSKITLKTQFVIVVDVNVGLNPIAGTAYILPISGTNIEINPSFTHSLDLTLSLAKNPSETLCTNVPGTQPNRTI